MDAAMSTTIATINVPLRSHQSFRASSFSCSSKSYAILIANPRFQKLRALREIHLLLLGLLIIERWSAQPFNTGLLRFKLTLPQNDCIRGTTITCETKLSPHPLGTRIQHHTQPCIA